MAASAGDAHPYPIYNARYRVIFPILDADGDLVTGAAGLDSELSQDTGTFADATNEATEIATSSGMYFLDIIATELDTKSTAVIVKTSTTGAKTTPMVLYPVRLPVLRTGTAQAGAASTITLDSGASAVDNFYAGCLVNITNNSPANALGQCRRILSYVGSTKVATVESTYGTNPSSASTFEILMTPEASSTVAFAGTAYVDPATAGRPNVNATHLGGTSQTGRDIGASVLLSAGSGAGQLDFTSGVVKANLAQILGTALTETAGQIAAAFKQFFNIGSPTGTVNLIPAVTAVTTTTSVTNAVGITSNVKTNQALANFTFLMTDSTTHAPATGKTVTVTRKIDAGAFGAGALSAVTEIANGMYNVDFAAGDLNGKVITLRATATGCDDRLERIVTQP